MRNQSGSVRSRGLPVGVWLALCLGLGCHAREAGPVSKTPNQDLTIEQAQAIVDQERAKLGLPEQVDEAPQSLADVLGILQHDDSVRFAKTRDYLAALDGVDALIVRATLEALWAEGHLTVAAAAGERAERKEAQIESIQELLKAQPNDAEQKARLAEVEADIAREQRLRRAFQVLAKPHQHSAMSLASEVERRNPERAEGYIVLANLFRLVRDWNAFEGNMQKAQARSSDRVGVMYGRAMELAVRLGDRAAARKALEALLAEHADFARARAQLVLLEDDAELRYAQLQQLKAVNPRHALVTLEGRAIETEYETAKALRSAQIAPVVAAPQQ